jgi:hypothetical protein
MTVGIPAITGLPRIAVHVHIMPYHMVKPSALELIKKGRKDYADVEHYSADPKAFLAFLDTLGIERAGLINYVAPKTIGFTPEVNDWSAKYCKAAPDGLIAFGGVLPGKVRIPARKWTASQSSESAPSRCIHRIKFSR